MDEPLSNLDAKLRVQTRTEIAALQRDLGVTTVYVTHDQVEAMTMGDRVAVHEGRRPAAGRHPAEPLRQAGQPVRRRLHRLARDEPARGARRSTGTPRSASYEVPVDRDAPAKKMHGNITVGVRPEAWRIVGEGEGPAGQGDGRRGARRRRASSTAPAASRARPTNIIVRDRRPRATAHKGETIHVTTDPQHVHVFDTEQRAALSKLSGRRHADVAVGRARHAPADSRSTRSS